MVTLFLACSSMHAWFSVGLCYTQRDIVHAAISMWYAYAVDVLTDLLSRSMSSDGHCYLLTQVQSWLYRSVSLLAYRCQLREKSALLHCSALDLCASSPLRYVSLRLATVPASRQYHGWHFGVQLSLLSVGLPANGRSKASLGDGLELT